MPEKECIEREAAFNAILKLTPKVDDDGYCWVIRGNAATAIDNIPAADVRPVKRGKWIVYTGRGKRQYMCSECSAEEKNPKVAHYCYNCGADMMEEQDGR